MSHKEHAFKLVRSGEVVLWAGAGLSLYAGYPKATDLARVLYKDLSPKHQKDIQENLPLEVLAEEFERAKSRKALLSSLTKAFAAPSSIELHTKIASITHFRTIITTNYDPLFELAYGDRGQVITNQYQVPSIDERKLQILKIHGDLSDTSGMILSKSDYTSFFNIEANNQLWNVVKERIATKSIIFIGYGFEDPNTTFIFDNIFNALGHFRKQAYYVAPDEFTPPHKQRYLKKKGINYINSTGEDFIDNLKSDIMKNFFSDYNNKLVPTDVMNEFLALQNLAPSLTSSNGHFTLTGVSPIEGEIEARMSFTVRKDDKIIQTLSDFATGRRFGEITITEDILVDSSFSIGELLLPGSNEPNSSISFRSQPNTEATFDLSFNNGFEISKLKARVFASQHLAEAHVDYKNLGIIVRKDLNDPKGRITFNLTLEEPYERTQDGIELLTLLTLLYKRESFTIHLERGQSFDQHLESIVDQYQLSIGLLEYFQKLRDIENFFKIKFRNIEGIDNTTYKQVDHVHKAIKGQPIAVGGHLAIHLDNFSIQVVEDIKGKLEEHETLRVPSTTAEEVKLHGQKLNLLHNKIEICSPHIANYSELVAGTTKTIIIKSKTNNATSIYFKDSPLDSVNL
jgi:hypothetical protein